MAKKIEKEVCEGQHCTSTEEAGDSHFCCGLMKVKDSFLSLGHFQLGNGQNVRF
jgi:hypothetical protein